MFFENAHLGRNAWWRWALTIVVTLSFWLLGHIPVVAFIEAETARLGLGDQAFLDGPFPAGVDQNLYLFLALLPFAVGFLALWLMVRWVHRKPFVAVMTGRPRFEWSRAFVAAGVWFVVSAVGLIVILPASIYTYQFDPARFLPLLLISLLVLPIQTTFEEAFFRGYLMQGLYLWLRSRIAALLIVTAIFVLIHFANPEFSRDYATGAVLYITISLLLGVCAVLDDGLEIPCGLHAANNFVLVALVSSPDGSFATYSLYSAELAALMLYSPWLDVGLAVAVFIILAVIYRWRAERLWAPAGRPMPELRNS